VLKRGSQEKVLSGFFFVTFCLGGNTKHLKLCHKDAKAQGIHKEKSLNSICTQYQLLNKLVSHEYTNKHESAVHFSV
jgi:hypothetical protein